MRTTQRGFDEYRRFLQIFVLFGAKEISGCCGAPTGMKDQIACVALIFGMAALCNMASTAVVQLIQATGVIA